MKYKETSRGFDYYEFEESNGNKCSIQKSSAAEDDYIWFGANKIGIKEFVAYRQPSAWVDMPEFDISDMAHHYVANNRMHLSREQVEELIPILQRFVKTGDISPSK